MTNLSKSFSAVALAGALVIASLGSAWASAGGFGAKVYAVKVSNTGAHTPGTGGAGLVSTAKLLDGQYEVVFVQKRDRCFATVTLGRDDTGAAARGFATIVHRSGNANAFFVRTRDTSGVDADRDFIVLAYCAQ